mmetsp:Transcript_17687/g.42659  ORF Transcript_17687/g.42659 Transcript_17687/m.42659 type:complete len:114 (-) Transcript_17687:65-406(-)
MVYIESWNSFIEAAQQLFLASPEKTRYLVKYRHVEAKLVLKVTDDVVCLKYRTDQAQDVRKMDKLNALFLRLMSGETVDAETAQNIWADIEAQESAPPVAATPPQGGKKKKGK